MLSATRLRIRECGGREGRGYLTLRFLATRALLDAIAISFSRFLSSIARSRSCSCSCSLCLCCLLSFSRSLALFTIVSLPVSFAPPLPPARPPPLATPPRGSEPVESGCEREVNLDVGVLSSPLAFTFVLVRAACVGLGSGSKRVSVAHLQAWMQRNATPGSKASCCERKRQCAADSLGA